MCGARRPCGAQGRWQGTGTAQHNIDPEPELDPKLPRIHVGRLARASDAGCDAVSGALEPDIACMCTRTELHARQGGRCEARPAGVPGVPAISTSNRRHNKPSVPSWIYSTSRLRPTMICTICTALATSEHEQQAGMRGGGGMRCVTEPRLGRQGTGTPASPTAHTFVG